MFLFFWRKKIEWCMRCVCKRWFNIRASFIFPAYLDKKVSLLNQNYRKDLHHFIAFLGSRDLLGCVPLEDEVLQCNVAFIASLRIDSIYVYRCNVLLKKITGKETKRDSFAERIGSKVLRSQYGAHTWIRFPLTAVGL